MNHPKYKIRLFGRTRGRNKKKVSNEEYLNIIDKYKVNELTDKIDYILDIGTGYGETSIFLSKNYKDKVILSCEKYIDGNLNLIKQIQNENIKNIRIHPGNVYEILDKLGNKNIFDKVWIFFPDPWPKKKHFKRRLINLNFLKKLHTNLKLNGEICIATDSFSYTKYMINNIYLAKKYFNWVNQDKVYLYITDYFNLQTKFYKKAINQGRQPILLVLKKI